MYSSTLSLTSALGGGWVRGPHLSPAALPPGKRPGTNLQEAGWSPGAGGTNEENFAPPPHRDSIHGPSSP
jgi:hypothetical protein